MKRLEPLSIVLFILVDCCLWSGVGASQSLPGKCLLEVNKTKFLDGPCAITMEKDGSFSIGGLETRPLTYFAMVSVTGKDVGEGFWNEEKGATHAHTRLGNLVRKGACWQNNTAKVCAWR